MLVDAIIVAGDGAGADVDPGADLGIADVGQVVDLAGGAGAGILDLDEVADVVVVAQLGARAQAGEGADAVVGADPGAVDDRHRQHMGAVTDDAVLEDAVGADLHALAEPDLALEDAADVDGDVAAAIELAADVDAVGVGQHHAAVGEAVGQVALVAAFEKGELRLAVDAQRLPVGCRVGGGDAGAVGHGGGDDIGQVVLVLGVVVLQGGQPALERGGRGDQDAGVDLVDLQGGGIGVLLLDDLLHLAVAVPHDPAIAGGVVGKLGQQRQLALAGRLGQALQGVDRHQRHVAIQHQRRHAVIEHRHGLGDGVAGAQLR